MAADKAPKTGAAAAAAGRVNYLATAEVRHPIKAAALLYSTPGFILRGPIYLVFVMVLVGLVYLIVAKKDIVVNAPLVLQRESTTVQAVGGGMVYDVVAEANAPIRAGQPLVVIQEKIRAAANPEQEAINRDIKDTEDKLDAAIKDYDHRISQLNLDLMNAVKGSSTEAFTRQASIDSIAQQVGIAQRSREDAARKLASAQHSLAQKKELYDRRDITGPEYDRAVEAVNDLQSAVHNADATVAQMSLQLSQARAQKSQADSQTSVEKLKSELDQQKANRERDIQRLQDRIADLRGRLSQASTLVQGVSYEESLAKYRSTIDGIVTEVAVKKGQLIDSGKQLVTIVKESAALEARVLVQNQDIGHLKYGQTVQIKYFAYPYQEYGIASGVISEIATKPGGVTGKESLYVVKVALDKEYIRSIAGQVKNLEIGIEGMAEIKTGDKRWIEMIFTPLSKFFQAEE